MEASCLSPGRGTVERMSDIRNHREPMQYRRFGKTGKMISVITQGGMRFREAGGQPREETPEAAVTHCAEVVGLALDQGINLLETAWGYGKSEHVFGKAVDEVLQVPRERFYWMTKGNAKTAAQMREMVAAQLAGLRTDHIDFYAWHGINNQELFDAALAPGGPVDELWKLKDEGVIGHVGFSTHGPTDTICRAIATDRFEFVNLHYYYFFQENWPAVRLAAARDMGVFIISPNNKGGNLYDPPEQLRRLCDPLTPLQFNARWCLRVPQVHTLSFGCTEAAHFAEMRGALPVAVPLTHMDLAIEHRLDGQLQVDPLSAYAGLEFADDPSGINIPEVLRFRRLWKCYGMHAFASWRYNMFEEKGHWFPGAFATPERVAQVDRDRAPPGIDLPALLNEAHAALYRPEEHEGSD